MNTVLGMIAVIFMDGTFYIVQREFLTMEDCVNTAFVDAMIWLSYPRIADTMASCQYLGVDT